MENMEKGVKEDWDVVKEDWKMVKDEAQDDWNKLDLDWNKLALSDAEVLPGESKVESDESPIVTEDANVIKCSKLCFVSQSSDNQDREECKKGCKSQKGEFKEMKEKFQKTEPSLLLGTSLDRCWEGCQSKPQCINGCNVMRTLQISQLKREKEQKALQDMTAKDVEVEKKEEEFKKEAADKEQEFMKANDKDEEFMKADSVKYFVVDASAGEEGGIEQPHVWTYVLWRPSFSADGLPSLGQEDAQESYAQMVRLIKSMMSGWEISGNEVVGDELPIRRR